MVVEDDKDLLEVYSDILQINGYMVIKAKNGQEAVSQFKIHSPDLVIMDDDMPIMTGLEAFSKIIEINNKARVVIVTGYSDSDARNIEAFKKGLVSIMSKPISLDTLLELAKKHCNEIIL